MTPQAPLVQTKTQSEYSMDDYAQGTNAVVAVISYTGYDMEDAMIINKAAFERGFGHGCVYKTHLYDLEDEEKRLPTDANNKKPTLCFSNWKPVVSPDEPTSPEEDEKTGELYGEKYCDTLDVDGLPPTGLLMKQGDPICCVVDIATGAHRLLRHKDQESAYVECVRVIGSGAGAGGAAKGSDMGLGGSKELRRVSITLRYPRNPVIGDKFSSRHGQKGTLSVLWPQENMPFTESGMTPDVMINPHAFPSRMTIGMLIESMAGKSGALHGKFQEGTPFQLHEENRTVDLIGAQLRAAGYGYCGSEPLYSGLSGKAMQADIFIGLVYYQRLRHMVSDKSQVRSTGPVTGLTRQPVKGRKRKGGIRLGEMERDALLSHGASFCLQDRLMHCSDAHPANVCGRCGSLLAVYSQQNQLETDTPGQLGMYHRAQQELTCKVCKSPAHVRPIMLPYVFRYLVNELAGMGIKLSLKLSD